MTLLCGSLKPIPFDNLKTHTSSPFPDCHQIRFSRPPLLINPSLNLNRNKRVSRQIDLHMNAHLRLIHPDIAK